MSVSPPEFPRQRPDGPIPPRRPPVRAAVAPIAPVPLVPPGVLARFGARVLDPQTAVQVPGARPNPTVYIGGSLLVRGLPQGSAGRIVERLQKSANLTRDPVRLTISRRDLALTEGLARTDESARRFDRTWTTRVLLSRSSSAPAPPPDAWEVLQSLRNDNADLAGELSLDHLMTACSDWSGVGGLWGGVGGLWGGVGGLWGGVGQGLAVYGSPGFGGRTPVVWSAPDPRIGAPPVDRAPVVALLDTGIGEHPWFQTSSGGFSEEVFFGGQPIGVTASTAEDPEYLGVVTDPINGMIDREAGHGTFIAGIVRQRCPQAYLLTVPVMPADGAVAEQEVLTALNQLLRVHLDGQATDAKNRDVIDVLSLSMGFYHETPQDVADDGPLAAVLQAFADAGVAVVAAAGNEATRSKFFPAALAPTMTSGVPMTSVGALNPDGHTIALFSNSGPWITTHAPGAGIVSTVPTTLSGGYGRSIAVDGIDPLPRATVDPDDYRSGFAIWSGTSFAAPWVAGEIAARIAAADDLGSVDVQSAITRSRAAVTSVLDERATVLTAGGTTTGSTTGQGPS